MDQVICLIDLIILKLKAFYIIKFLYNRESGLIVIISPFEVSASKESSNKVSKESYFIPSLAI